MSTESAEHRECSILDEVFRAASYSVGDHLLDGYYVAESAYFALCEYQSAPS